MVLIGLGLALFYTVFESILSIFLQVNVDVMQRIFGSGPSTSMSVIILCLFAISDPAQYHQPAQAQRNRSARGENAFVGSSGARRSAIRTRPAGQLTFSSAPATSSAIEAGIGRQGQSELADASSRGRLAENFERVLASAKRPSWWTGSSSARQRQALRGILDLGAQDGKGGRQVSAFSQG
jgi:hypothetical protein